MPFEIRHAIELVDIRRLERTIRKSPHFSENTFTPQERAYCEGKRYKFEHYAARFAAKQAVIGVLPLHPSVPISFLDIEICRRPSGIPYVRLSMALKEVIGLAAGARIEISISHERRYALGAALFYERG